LDVTDKDDVTAANSEGGKKREHKTVNTAKKAALIQLSSKILEKQQEKMCKNCEALGEKLGLKEEEVKCLHKTKDELEQASEILLGLKEEVKNLKNNKEEQEQASEILKASLEAKEREIEELKSQKEHPDGMIKRCKVMDDTGLSDIEVFLVQLLFYFSENSIHLSFIFDVSREVGELLS